MIDNLITNLEVDEVNNGSLLFDFDEIEQMINSPLTNLEVDQVNSEYLQFSSEINNEQVIENLLTNLESEQIVSINQSINLLLTNDNYNYNLSFQGG